MMEVKPVEIKSLGPSHGSVHPSCTTGVNPGRKRALTQFSNREDRDVYRPQQCLRKLAPLNGKAV